MTENEEVVGRRIEDITVRTRCRNGFDRRESLRVEEDCGIAGHEAGVVFWVDRDAVPGRIVQRAHELVGIEIKYTNRIAAGDISPAVDAVRRDVVDPAGGGNLRGGENLVRLGRDVSGRSDLGET